MTDAPRHTAAHLADDVAAGMDPDVETVPAQYYDAAVKRIAELEVKLKQGADYFSELMSKRDVAVKNLRDELAREKAESARLVHSGETEARNPRFFIRQSGSILWQRIGEADRYHQVSAFDVEDPDTRCCIPGDEMVYGVHLEQWEK